MGTAGGEGANFVVTVLSDFGHDPAATSTGINGSLCYSVSALLIRIVESSKDLISGCITA
jgi:hypothetical protein